MTKPSIQTASHHEHFSLPLFLLTIVATLTGLGVILRFAAPTVWAQQWHAGILPFALVFVTTHLLTCFFEFFFHRYILHRPAIPGLSRFYRQHTMHHALTRIVGRPSRDGRGILTVENKFPITEAEQGEGSFFPWYSLAIFSVLLAPFFAVMTLLVPALPWFIGGYVALAFSLMLYEFLHAVNHWPLEKWIPLIEHRSRGRFWQGVYSFHLRHHAVIDCNESVSGFFGLPLADWTFATLVIPPTIYADGEAWRAENFKAPKPRSLIRWLDQKADGVIAERRSQSAQAPRELVYTKGEEIANWLTHGVGAVLSVVGLTLLIVYSSMRGDAWHVVSFTVFGLSMFTLYTASTLYHLSRSERRRWLFQRLDHAAIFIFIAGTYTPFLLTNLRGVWGWTLFGIIWGLCGSGALFKVIAGARSRVASVVAYLFSGWLIVVAVKPMLTAVPAAALWLLLAGSVCYTLGVPFYLMRRLRYHHAFWHGSVLFGSACHFLAVMFLLRPVHT